MIAVVIMDFTLLTSGSKALQLLQIEKAYIDTKAARFGFTKKDI